MFKNLKEKLESDTNTSFDNDAEYYFAVGHFFHHLVEGKKDVNKDNVDFNKLLLAENKDTFKENLKTLFNQYSEDLNIKNSKKFNNLTNMIFAYTPKGNEVDKEMLTKGLNIKSFN